MHKLFCFLLIFLSFLADAQKVETLTNNSVISLHKAGLDEALIVSKIETSPSCKFDVSTNGLIALKKAGLSKDVIQAMMNRSETAANAKPGDKPQVNAVPDAKNYPIPETINAVHFYDKTTKMAKPLERGTATMKVDKKILGYGGADVVYEMEGEKSAVRATADQATSFIVNTGSGPADIFVLYKVDVKKGKREAVMAQYGTGGSTKGSKGLLTIDIKQLKPGIYELSPSAKLVAGEYFFANKTVSAATTNADVYAFGVD